MTPDRPIGSFLCPLRGSCFTAAASPYPSYQACNNAVTRFQNARTPRERHARARAIYLRCLPLVRSTLHRFCHPYRPGSRCYPGACLPEDLLGDSYPIFHRALNTWDSTVGVDFLGYVSQRLYWGLEHRARHLDRARCETPLTELTADPAFDAAEDRLLAAVTAEELVNRLDHDNAELLRRYASGYSSEELARWAGISRQAVRKRLERIRKRLREVPGRSSEGS